MEECTNDDPVQKEEDLFYFESDQLALRGNKDYSELLKTLFILTAQRARAFKDFENIQQLKKSALEDPVDLLEKLKSDSIQFPPLQTIAQIPFINWYSYDTKIPEEELKAIYSDRIHEKKESDELDKVSKKNTHKQPWTSEEQKRLEELLVIYPPEPIELRRIKKIAKALGNRTVQQVSSRLQKYFLKLHKAGLHIPGRQPKSTISQRKGKHKHSAWKPTTFFPEYNVSVYMDDLESVPGPSMQNDAKRSNSSTPNYLMPVEYHQPDVKEEAEAKSEIELQLDLLRRVKADKMKESGREEPYRHISYKCDYCNEEPIIGTRWHCNTCIQESIDFCTDCLVAQLYSDKIHPLHHKFITLPHPDDTDFNMSSDSDSESANENSNNNDISDSDVSARSSIVSSKGKAVPSPISNVHTSTEKNEKNGLKKSPDESKYKNFVVDTFLNELMYKDTKDINSYSTQDLGYSYLHSNMSLKD